MIELIGFIMQQFLLGVILNMFSDLILTLKLIKVQFVNKGIEFIILPSIFKPKFVLSSIPYTYFENKELSIICYKYMKYILSCVLNYNILVTELDIETSI